jgi:hypothetical protein
MREELLDLIGRIEEIREKFTMSGGNGFPRLNIIYNNEVFLNWKQELRFELQEIHDRQNDNFIWSVLVLFKQKFNGWSDEAVFNELAGSLKAIEKNISKYYPEDILSETSKKYSQDELLEIVISYIKKYSGGKKPITLQSVRKALPNRKKPNEVEFLLNTLIKSGIVRKSKGPKMKGIDGTARNIDYYEINKVVSEVDVVQVKKPKIFISHSSADIEFVKPVVELLEDIGVRHKELFCSSVPGYGIPLGEDIYDYLRKQFDDYDLHVILFLSDNYYLSAACLNEMGAAWVLKNRNTIILAPGFEYQSIKGAVNPRQISMKLDTVDDEIKKNLGDLKDIIINDFNLSPLADIRWEKKRDRFILNVKPRDYSEDTTILSEVRNIPELDKKINENLGKLNNKTEDELVRRDGDVIFLGNDPDPICSRCFEADNKIIHLHVQHETCWVCPVCKTHARTNSQRDIEKNNARVNSESNGFSNW